ncbi:MAG TPA: radical SAM protein [Ignavibacteriales bacterium]|nr:radical SAM protein [Ignavibacteriales bacterium]
MKHIFSTEVIRRFATLTTHKIYSMPIVILMPHSRCNCRCVMCDIWKGNNNIQQLEESDILELLVSLKKLNTKSVVMSGGEALMHPNFFRLCEIIKSKSISIVILSTGLLLKKYSKDIIDWSDEVIVSLDGSREVHNRIRNIPNAFEKLKEGVSELKILKKNFRVTGRSVIQKENFKDIPNIVNAAHEIGLDQISFLTADVTTDAFNRPELWDNQRTGEVKLSLDELAQFKDVIESLIKTHSSDFDKKYIAESPDKLRRFYNYYAAHHNLVEFPKIKCNAPWVSSVIEADGSVRPCFFHHKIGNIKDSSLNSIINSSESISFRKNLDIATNPICKKCVCYLNLSPFTML